MTEEFRVDKIAKKKNKELERAMKLRSNEDLIDSVNRISAMEFEQENPVKVKIKKKPKPDKKTINPGRAGKGNFNVGGSVKKVDGFPDHSGDGKITQKDILIEKGVIKKKAGGLAEATAKLKAKGFKKGGLAGRLAKRGYGKARK